MHYELRKLLKQILLVNAFSSRNANDEYLYSATTVSVACRIQLKNVVIRDAQGKEVISSCQIYVNGDAVIATNSKITLPDGTKPLILAITTGTDELGTAYHKVIYT